MSDTRYSLNFRLKVIKSHGIGNLINDENKTADNVFNKSTSAFTIYLVKLTLTLTTLTM